jgi:hypothetical protein
MRIRFQKRRDCVIATFAFVTALGGILCLTGPSGPRVDVIVSRVQDAHELDWIEDSDQDVAIFVRIVVSGTEPVWFRRERTQFRAAGVWGKPEDARWLETGPIWPAEDREYLAAVVPRNSNALRLFLDCRHPTLYDTLINLLNQPQYAARFPRLRQWGYWGFSNLRLVAGWRRVSYRLAVPEHNKVTRANSGGPPQLPVRTPWAARIAQFRRCCYGPHSTE